MLSSDRASLPTCEVVQVKEGELTGFASGTFIKLQAHLIPPPPDGSIVCVNILWVMSLVLSIASALFATSKQRWINKYTRLPQVAMTIALLHISVFMFLVGLVIFFFTVYKTVAIVVSTTVGLFVVAYSMLTILACLDRNCPYRTPISSVWWSSKRERLGYT
jgi:hypothetical protein